jgi:acetyl esterase/lipase
MNRSTLGHLATRIVFGAGLFLIVGCDSTDNSAQNTATPPVAIVASSATVAPVAPTANNLDSSNIGVQDFTPGAPAVSGSNSVTVTPKPAPTETTIKVPFAMSDGLTIVGIYYSAPVRPAPAALLLHMNGSNKESWKSFAPLLQAAGYNVLAIDLRGHGETGGGVDWTKAPADISEVLRQLRSLPGVDPSRVTIIGASIGGNLAIVGCAQTLACKSAILISPALDYEGVKTLDAVTKYGKNPLLIVASRDDKPTGTDSVILDKAAQGNHTLKLYDGTVHGTNLFSTQPDLATLLIQWLASH